MKEQIVRILENRAQKFESINHSFGAREVKSAIDIIKRLVPPELFTIHGVSKSFAVGVEVEITDCIKGHEFHIGEKVTIVENDDNMWICRNKKGVEWCINEDEANVC
jgi:hypothetical protein